jgi:group II intron reverse transcriptase/maturase
MAGTSRLDPISTRQQQIATLAKQMPDKALHSLSRHLDLDWMREAYRRTRKDGATGVDGQTADQFAADLEGNLGSLLDGMKSGTYRAPPVRRVHIPKGDGSKTRPIGVPTFSDKVQQRAIAMVLEAVYEEEFYDFSYGFRPGRSAHDALEALRRSLWSMRGGWVLEVDIASFFDTLDHQALRDILRRRVSDGVVVRMVGKWLNAGVLEGGIMTRAEAGTPQGGVISPLLANVYLHEVLDRWWVTEVLPRMRGRATLVRYADDFVIVFAREDDARRVQAVLPKRFARFGLTLHPQKTRLLPFMRPDRTDLEPTSFDFLGFTHNWARSRKGKWVPRRTTAKDRFSRALKRIALWCRRARHVPIADQAKMLRRKLLGHYEYYGLTGNSDALSRFYKEVQRTWQKWLSRRSQRAYIHWAAFARLEAKYPLPRPRVVHSIYRRPANP